MRDRSEIKKFIADQEERHTGKRPEYTDLIRISDAAHYFQMLEAKPLNIACVSGSFSVGGLTELTIQKDLNGLEINIEDDNNSNTKYLSKEDSKKLADFLSYR